MGVYARVQIGSVQVIALNRLDGFSSGNFSQLNVADYVGDDVQNVTKNINKVQSLIGASDIAVMSAEHGNNVIEVSQGGKCLPSDVLITRVRNLALLALSADCVTVALIDTQAELIAVVHSGWQGLAAQVLQTAIDSILASGSQRENLLAVIGPAICAECYEVSQDRVTTVSAINSAAILDSRHIDLCAGIKATLVDNAIRYEQILGCTFENEDLFSFRRADGEPTGRGGMVVCICTDEDKS